MQKFEYTVIYQPEPDGGFNVLVPALPEICTCGATIDEARANAREAIRCVIESMMADGEPIPPEQITEERLAVSF